MFHTLGKYNRTELIDLFCIQEFRNKLTKENRNKLTVEKIRSCSGFVVLYILSFLPFVMVAFPHIFVTNCQKKLAKRRYMN